MKIVVTIILLSCLLAVEAQSSADVLCEELPYSTFLCVPNCKKILDCDNRNEVQNDDCAGQSTDDCTYRCVCKDGYFRKRNSGLCVSPDQCEEASGPDPFD